MRKLRPLLGHKVVLSAVVVFVLLGVFLPAALPATMGGQAEPNTPVRVICRVLFWIDTIFLPRGTWDGVRIPVNLLTCVVWGLVVGLSVEKAIGQGRGEAGTNGSLPTG